MEERIKYLFRQYLNNTCTRKEFEEFFSYINEATHNELIRELIRKAYEETAQAGSSLTYVDERGHLVLTEPAWDEKRIAGAPSRKKNWPLIAIAACVAVLLAGIAWFMYQP